MLSSAFPGSGDKGTRMLAEMVRLGFLITSLRPAMTTTDALEQVTKELRAAGAHEIPETAGLLKQLEALQHELAAHNAAEPEHQAAMRERLSAAVTEISAEGRTPLCLDLRLDAEVTLPEPVGREMAAAASGADPAQPQPGRLPGLRGLPPPICRALRDRDPRAAARRDQPRDRPGLPGRVPGQHPAAAARAGRRPARAPR
jgi:hypothetical protein